MSTNNTRSGWRVVQSAAMELDTVIWALSGWLIVNDSSKDFSSLIKAIPDEWLAELENIAGNTRGISSIIESLAILAGVLLEPDYSRATLAMRSLDLDTALQRMIDLSAPYGLEPDRSLPDDLRLANLASQLQTKLYQEFGLEPNPALRYSERREMEKSIRILQPGEPRDRFWHWLDRLYYEAYHPWRVQRQAWVEAQEERAVNMLGAREKSGAPPELSWLPEQNPLLRFPQLKNAVLSGSVQVVFWLEPFGLMDSWQILPGQLIISFSKSEEIYENFRAFAVDLASRVQALSDPTRLIILRLIRNFSMTNTDMAKYLNLARPTVSIHARVLREAGLINTHQEGRAALHEINSVEVHRVFRDLERFLDLPEEEKEDKSC